MKAYTKNGWLTPYAMACGYIHRQGDNVLKQQGAWGVYTVHLARGNNPDCWDTCGGFPRKTFDSIIQARAAYKKACGNLERRYENAIGKTVIS